MFIEIPGMKATAPVAHQAWCRQKNAGIILQNSAAFERFAEVALEIAILTINNQEWTWERALVLGCSRRHARKVPATA